MFIAVLYLAVTIVGFFLFRGIPILNVALGFPIGAVVAYREPRAAHSAGDPTPTQSPLPDPRNCTPLRRVVFWGLVTAGVTMLACWAELAASLLVLKVFGLDVPLARWFPLLPPPGSSGLFRTYLFAIMISPGLQILTTVFGGVVVLLLNPRELPPPR